MTVWPDSITRERPLRSSSSLPWMPVLMMPIRALMTKMPPSVTASIADEEPERALVAAHRPRVQGPQQAVPEQVLILVPAHARGRDEMAMTTTTERPTTANSPRIRAIVPRAMKLSKT